MIVSHLTHNECNHCFHHLHYQHPEFMELQHSSKQETLPSPTRLHCHFQSQGSLNLQQTECVCRGAAFETLASFSLYIIFNTS